MPNVTGTIVPINMNDPIAFGALGESVVGSATSTSFETFGAGRRWVFTGTFSYDQGVPVSGTISSITYYENNALAISITGLSMSLGTFYQFLASGSTFGFSAYMFSGDDVISGSSAFDNLNGFNGNDAITAGDNGDALRGGNGDDTLNGGAGFDHLFGDDGIDSIHGGAGNDEIDGGAGNDALYGGADADNMDGGLGNDTINGEAGGDAIRSSGGVDSMDGGADDDSLIFDRSTSSLSYTITAADVTSALGATFADGSTARNFEHFRITTGSGNDTLYVTALMPTTGYGSNYFDGGAGTDRLFADFSASLTGANVQWVNIEELHIQGSAGDDYYSGAIGNDELFGNGGADYLNDGGGGIDLLSGGAGNDSIYGGTGDTLLGGADNDNINVALSSASDTATVDGGAGTDRLTLTWAAAEGINVTLGRVGGFGTDFENFWLDSGEGNDTLTVQAGGTAAAPTGAYQWNAYGGTDRLNVDLSALQIAIWLDNGQLTAGALTINTSQVDITNIIGGSANDRLTGNAAADIFHGGAGEDILDGGEGNDQLFGGADNDTLYGRGGIDILDGGDGNDIIRGEGGGTIDGGAGDDLFVLRQVYYQDAIVWNAGGVSTFTNNDTYSSTIVNMERFDLATSDGDDSVTIVGPVTGDNFWDAGERMVLVFTDPSNPFGGVIVRPEVQHDRLTIDFSMWSTEAVNFLGYQFLGSDYYLRAVGVDEFWITATDWDDVLQSGGIGANRIFGLGGNDIIQASGGADYLDGGAGDDVIRAGEGSDQVFGGSGNDILASEGGNDLLDGGSGIDGARYLGSSTNPYSWHRNVDGAWTLNSPFEGTDTLRSIEFLRFSDRDVYLDRPQSNFSTDGVSDFFLRNTATGGMVMWFNASNTNAASMGTLATNWVSDGTGDFNGDGRDDILWRDSTNGNVSMWFMNNQAVSGAAGLGISLSWNVSGIGDVNGDGRDDIVLRNTNGDLVLWFMNGGAVTGESMGNVSSAWQIEVLGDFNGDGRDDFIWRNSATGDMSMWLMNGTAVTPNNFANVGGNWNIAGVGDLNGDGRDDVIWRDQTTGNTALWFMNGGTITSQSGFNVASNYAIADIGDFNGDGRDDIIWRNTATNDVLAWYMNGGVVQGGAFLGNLGGDWIINPGG